VPEVLDHQQAAKHTTDNELEEEAAGSGIEISEENHFDHTFWCAILLFVFSTPRFLAAPK
jgi:hypothetical protein